MSRVKHAVASRRRHKRVLKQAKGQFGGRRKLYRTARESINRAMRYATRDRKANKRNFRQLWNARITAAVRNHGMSYSKFIGALKKKNVVLNRKMLADIAVHDEKAFGLIVALAKA